jgi:protein TonB
MAHEAILSADYRDILFHHRNKYYGAYELRKNYRQRALPGLLVVFAASVVLSAFILSAKKAPEIIPALKDRPVTISSISLPKILPPDPVSPSKPAPAAATQPAGPPLIVKDPEVPVVQPKPDGVISDHIPGPVAGAGDRTVITPGPAGEAVRSVITPPVPAVPLKYVEQMPSFDGDLHTFLGKHLKYPPQARDNDVRGRVIVQFVVNEDGTVSGAQVLRGIGGGCDEEALRVVRSMPPWKAGKQNGRPVKVYMTLPILFVLN